MSLMISLSIILCTKNTCRRNRAKDCQIVYKNELIYNRNTGHLLRAELSNHDIVQEADQIRDGILHNHRQCQI